MYDWAKVILTSHVRFTWPTLDIEVNGRVRGAFRITRYAFIATVIHRAHVVNQELTAKVQRVNLSIFHLEFNPERFNNFFHAPNSCLDMTLFEKDLDNILVTTELGTFLKIILNS